MNPRLGKIYELHFGKDIFVKYKIVSINYAENKAVLERLEDWYMGCCEEEEVELNKLVNKRKIRDW